LWRSHWAFGGTDYGLTTMAITVRMPLELFEQKLFPYNRYAILANLGTATICSRTIISKLRPYRQCRQCRSEGCKYQILLPGDRRGN
jgi:hypothetical protein